MQNVRFEVVDDGTPGSTPERPNSNNGDTSIHTGKVITSTAGPRIRTLKLEKGGPEVQVISKIAQVLLAYPNYRQEALEFAKDLSVPGAEKFLVITFQGERKPAVDLFVLRAASHSEAGAAAMATAEAKGLDPVLCYSARLSPAVMPLQPAWGRRDAIVQSHRTVQRPSYPCQGTRL